MNAQTEAPPSTESRTAMGDVDFSRVNLQYLIGARDLARGYPERAAVLLGANDALIRLLGDLDPHALAAVTAVRGPLLVLRQEPWWWNRLFTAIQSDRPDELRAVLEQAALIIANRGPGGIGV